MSPSGTISRTVFDTLGRVSSQWVGTDDTPSSGSWSPSNNSGAIMTKVAQFEFDGGATGGNGNQTKVIRYLTSDVEANAGHQTEVRLARSPGVPRRRGRVLQ